MKIHNITINKGRHMKVKNSQGKSEDKRIHKQGKLHGKEDETEKKNYENLEANDVRKLKDLPNSDIQLRYLKMK